MHEIESEKYWDIYQIMDDTSKKELDIILVERSQGDIKRIVYRYEI